jgi:hypothetical protein
MILAGRELAAAALHRVVAARARWIGVGDAMISTKPALTC